jgi:hypothetical protein
LNDYVVIGKDVDSGAATEFSIKAASIPDAAAFAAKRGIRVEKVRTREGVTFLARDGAFSKEGDDQVASESSSHDRHSDLAMIFFSFVIPMVGLIAGAVRLARRDSSGTGVLVAACLGCVFWSVLSFALMART